MPEQQQAINPYPANLPLYQKAHPREVSFLGKILSDPTPGETQAVFGIKREDRLRHMLIVGKSGVGKSKLVESLIRQDTSFEYGLCYVDVRGHHIASILDFVFEQRINDVVVVDPLDIETSISFNPLRNVKPELEHRFIGRTINIFEELSENKWNQQQEYLLRMLLRALFEYPRATLAGLPAMILDDSYREEVTRHIKNGAVLNFFQNEYLTWRQKFYAEAIIPLLNIFTEIFSNPYLKTIFSREENKLNFTDFIIEKKIILVSLAKEKLGNKNSKFFGALLLQNLLDAGVALAQSEALPQKEFYVYLDDINHLAAINVRDLFEEGKKYNFALTATLRNLSTLDFQELSHIQSNTGTLISFEVNGEDAVILEKEMQPKFRSRELVNLGGQCFVIKMSIDGKTESPFLARTLQVLETPHESFREKIIQNSREQYGA